MKSEKTNIHIIGGGNLGVALAMGLSRFAQKTKITITRRNIKQIQSIENKNIRVSSDNKFEIEKADIIILTIKPYQVDTVLSEILPSISNKIIVSAVSGVDIETLEQKVNGTNSIVRIMPSIAAQFGASATCISFSDKNRRAGQKVLDLFNLLGTALVIEDKLMDGATILGACGTAYALRYIRAAMQAGIEIGFDSKTALAIASQTVKGAAQMLLEEKIHPEQLIDRVTTPQGCTIVGLNEMEHQGFSSSLIKGIKVSYEKIRKV
ncbi:MAG TPA: pyrroline-5-carboxylate reductase [Ignavibacteria bacterium]|nr:pyrroline-5-carboxylate reductase [Ignavibacteria bacterium]